MKNIKEILHAKRLVTEAHIRQLQQEGKQGERYTSMMPDIPFFVLALLCDVGWLIYLIAGFCYLVNNGIGYLLDLTALIAMLAVIFGVGYTIYMNKIHEKEIAAKRQKNLSFGLTAYAGLAGGIIGILQIVTYTNVPPTLVWMTVGGFIDFVMGLPLYLSFRKGIIYGVQ